MNNKKFTNIINKANSININFSDEFLEKLKYKYLDIEDLLELTDEQINFLKTIEDLEVYFYKYDSKTIKSIDLKLITELCRKEYKYYVLIIELIYQARTLLGGSEAFPIDEFCKEINNSKSVNDMKNIINNYGKKILAFLDFMQINDYPEEFIEKNKELFLIDVELPKEVKQRYFRKQLADIDVINYCEQLQNIHVEHFLDKEHNDYFKRIAIKLGEGNLQKIIKEHKDVFEFLHKEKYKNDLDYISPYKVLLELLPEGEDYEKNFNEAIKQYYKKYRCEISRDAGKFILPSWIQSMNFELIEKYETMEDLKKYNGKTILLNDKQQAVIDFLGINNLIKIDEETNYFSYKSHFNKELDNMYVLSKYISQQYPYPLHSLEDYNEVRKHFAVLLDQMRLSGFFQNEPNYDCIKEGTFRNDFKEIFMDKKAPYYLETIFYRGKISPSQLRNKEEYIKYLLDKDLKENIDANFEIKYIEYDILNQEYSTKINLLDLYSEKFGKEEILKLICKYGLLISSLTDLKLNSKDTKEMIDKKIRKAIYNKILRNNTLEYRLLNEPKTKVKEFVEEYPDIFLEFDQIPELHDGMHTVDEKRAMVCSRFYTRNFKFELIREYPQLVNFLKDKNLELAFNKLFYTMDNNMTQTEKELYKTHSDLLKKIGNENFLKLCAEYGEFFEYLNVIQINEVYEKDNFEDIKAAIEKYISNDCYKGVLRYRPNNAPKFLKEKHLDLFLDEGAPQKLREYFYVTYPPLIPLNFNRLSLNKDWFEYLENKSISTLILRNANFNSSIYNQTKRLFNCLGENKVLRLALFKPKTIDKMIEAGQVEKIKTWYDSTGQKFIPDYVVMQNFPIDEIDKFLKASSIWSKLMKIERYSNDEEGRDALLKLAYVFGIFDNDQKGMNQLLNLINGLPKTVKCNAVTDLCITNNIYKNIIDYGYQDPKQYSVFVRDRYKEQFKLIDILKEEGYEIDTINGILCNTYTTDKEEASLLKLNIDRQKYPKSAIKVRETLEKFNDTNLLNPEKAHQLFGGFNLIYDKDFKDFLVENLEEILSNTDYTNKIANIQKQFREIKIANSNRKLTLDLAISYIQQNKYTDVEVGNEEVAEISSIAGYSQSDFDTLQLIYNYGKQRVFSSIPRIKNQQDKYNYEILRLDDPLALAIGTLTDCCQEIGNVAEMCVEHSMVDKNGRVFVIKDELGNIISQSWVWRNKNVLCFDNIEIPNKAFARIEKANKDKKEFTNEVYNIYKKVAKELIEIDEKKYKELLEEGKITKEQFEGLKLSKVTVGLGYNDIAESINEYTRIDTNPIRPLEFTPTIKLNHTLYTNDSETQYILEESTTSTLYNGNTLSLYHDELKIYTKDNFNGKELLKLKKLEIVTKGNTYNLVTDWYNEPENIMSELAYNCELDEEKTKVLLHPNYAIIYEEKEDTIKIGQLFYNRGVNSQGKTIDITDKVLLQLKLALEEIIKNKNTDIELLEEEQKEFYKKAMELNNEIDIEKGISFKTK